MEENDQIGYNDKMNFFEKIIHSLQGTMECPTSYGWFHIMFIVIITLGTILICKYFKDCTEKTTNKIVMICWIIIAVLELYKQIEFSFSFTDGKSIWDYQFYAFPFQLCSTQLYILPFIFLLKEGKLRNAMIAYIMTFSFFGGLAVFVYPNDVFVETIGINIQTMIHHGLQILIGIFLFVKYRKEYNFKFYVRSIYVFLCLLLIAFTLNIVVHNILISAGNDETFNMFYIGPYHDCSLPLLSLIYPKVPYVVFFLIYMLGFILISFIIYKVETLIYKLILKIKYDKATI